jgi:P63C domain
MLARKHIDFVLTSKHNGDHQLPIAEKTMSDEKAAETSMASQGGKAAAANMTPEERRERAQKAAMARWQKDVVIAPHIGEIKVANIEIPCCVFSDGTRVLHERGVMKALGVTRRGGQRKEAKDDSDGGAQLPLFVAPKNLIPFVDEELSEVLKKPIWYRPPSGLNSGRPHKGIRAELLPKICNVWLKARDAGVLGKAQLIVAANADIINRGLAEVGIDALVDEATGFQDVRAKDALAKILERFVAKEIQPYLATFPLDFFRELCRLRGIPFPENMRLPPYFGKLVNRLVYCRLAPGVLAELHRKNPVTENGRRKDKNYKWLTPTVGHPKLLQLLGSEVTLMRMSKAYDEFETLVDKYHQVYKPLPLFDWAERGENKS